MAIVVRDSSLEDFPQINYLGKWVQENSNFKECGWSESKAYRIVKDGSNPSSDTLILVAEEDGELIGFFVGQVVECFFSEKRIAQDLGIVFKPEKRRGIGSAINQIISRFCLWAETKDAVATCIGITSGIAGDGYQKLLERHDFKQVGVLLKKQE